ncbi:MAG: hypothetical protein ABIY70_14415 [Capsulimonas sp.]|uniref:hypothetical protein n=1 Tax=Capsulimonas sp. TaxID=2494211 RepID=UPI003264C99F
MSGLSMPISNSVRGAMNEIEPPHWVNAETAWSLKILLNLPPDLAASQDWEIVCADADRLPEFFDLYENGDLDINHKHALMLLIVSSFDDYWRSLEDNVESVEQQFDVRIERLLRQDFLIHLHTIRYWCCVDVEDLEENPDHGFSVTPLMRRIWADCFKPEYQKWMKDYE